MTGFLRDAEVGDVLCCFYGGNTSYVRRPSFDSLRMTFVGDAYVMELMDGEAIHGWIALRRDLVKHLLFS